MHQPAWTPRSEAAAASRIVDFGRWVRQHRAAPAAADHDYEALRRWSIEHPEAFWGALADYFEVRFAVPPEQVLRDPTMPGADWFPGSELNLVDHVGRGVDPARTAVVVEHEDGATDTWTYGRLRADTAAMARFLRDAGIGPGDRVVGYLPNGYEGVVAFLATATLGALWAQVGMDYSPGAAADRLAQLEPAVLVTGTGYAFRGRRHDRADAASELCGLLPTLTAVVTTGEPVRAAVAVTRWADALATSGEPIPPVAVPFAHPLWALFTSGTTGKPKAIVHGHGGVLLEQLKSLGLHTDLRPEDTFFWYTTPNWMMWNVQVCGLLFGATAVLYAGDPLHPGPERLWDLVAKHDVAVFGTSPGYLGASEAAGVVPRPGASLRTIASTGSTLPASANRWVREVLGDQVQLASVSGGTDVVGSFVGAAPTTPVYDGEISARALGVALEAWDDAGNAVTDQVGELVVTHPIPSMPVMFWDDPDGSRYRDAYFSTYPGVWRQGDWITVTSRGTVLMHGRSDATLNRRGIRLGSAEIYAAVESLDDVVDSLVIGVERADGEYWMPLFVVPSATWDEGSEARVREVVAARASKHHVPDCVELVRAVPRTRTGKKMEVPVKRIVQGADPAAIGALDATDDPAALLDFVRFRTAE
ncbi:acetoacetate--CoA ligase [Nocardioides marmoriginsengisoli]|uniref:Acetoacetate--CoA ligase n=1 Tax=Nocardioides marmoriginsengisoli TaxID=661483 RepID=A0A3N0CBP3_9ACTN|nr:acetoacetate--CoA ligase [Nocardioides marmoriginsengisoli]RNL60681.1 acetoacetate--CoA ligase [Nocardioides marmoriginsengisoli]